MPLPTYENQSTWKEIQKFLPESIHFDESHTPVEEWWGNRGHTIHLDRWRSLDAKVRVIMHHGVGTNGRQMSLLLSVPLLNAGFEAVALDMPMCGMTKVAAGTTVA
jgi:alpha-beta hydrolase superfamily lysophospholipase